MKKNLLKCCLRLRRQLCLVHIWVWGQSVYAATPSNGGTLSPIDENLIQEERLADALKKRGVINESTSKEDTLKAVENT